VITCVNKKSGEHKILVGRAYIKSAYKFLITTLINVFAIHRVRHLAKTIKKVSMMQARVVQK
jgi:hypothetical protein